MGMKQKMYERQTKVGNQEHALTLSAYKWNLLSNQLSYQNESMLFICPAILSLCHTVILSVPVILSVSVALFVCCSVCLPVALLIFLSF